MLSAGFVVPFLLASIVEAAPGLDVVQLSKRQSITALSSEQISSFTPFTFFASAAYCNPNTTINFSCGGMSSILSFCKIGQVVDRSVNSKLRRKPGLHPNGIGRRR